MKWIFLINNALFLSEFFGKLAAEAIKQGDECLVVFNSKVAEYGKKKFYPKEAKFISKIDWCIDNYNPEKQEFGGLSWKELFPNFDRFKSLNFNYNNSLKMVSHLYQFFGFIFRKEKPDIIISEPPAGLFHKVGYYFCRMNNIPYIGISDSRFDNRIDIYDSEFTFSKYKETFDKIDISESEREFASDFVKKFIMHKHLPSYVGSGLAKIRLSQFKILKHYFLRTKEEASILLRYLINRKRFREFDYESEARFKRTVSAFFRMEKRQFRILLQKKIFSEKSHGKDSDKFFLFPLQYQPESSTSVWATYYSDQLSTIRNIAFSLPFPYKLYVKEHPASVGLRQKNFYRNLKKIPNVVLLSPYENVENLIKNSSGIINLTSTVGMEACLAGKPVYVLGNVYYFYHPFCRKVKNFDELRVRIKEDLENGTDVKDLENVNNNFVISLFRNTIKGSIVSAGGKEDDNDYKSIYDNLKFYAVSKKP